MIGLAWLVMAYREALRRSAEIVNCVGKDCSACERFARSKIKRAFK
jgi:hypothetical protein